MATPARDVQEVQQYFLRDPPPGAGIALQGNPREFKERRRMAVDSKTVTFVDARTAIPGGLTSWDFNTHGFTCFQPPPCVDFLDRKLVMKEYYPKLAEVTKSLTGAKGAYVWTHATRSEKPVYAGMAYSRFAHSDAGPESPPMLRRLLRSRFGVPEDEANGCDLAMVNVWFPRDRPAFRDPLCLLDCSTMNQEDDLVSIRYVNKTKQGTWENSREKLVRDTKFQEGYWTKAAMDIGPGPAPVPQSNGTGLMGPVYQPSHRWVYCSDQRPDEAWLFKQYDTREGVAKYSFHNSFHDPHYDNSPDTPPRRSAEFRLLLTFPKKSPIKPASKL